MSRTNQAGDQYQPNREKLVAPPTHVEISRDNIELIIIDALEASLHTIDIICFEISSETVIELIKKRIRNGLQVRIMCEKRKASIALLEEAYDQTKPATIHLSQPNDLFHTLHQKLIFIDDDRLLFGSFNLSDTSLKKNIEIIFDTREREIVESAKQQLYFLENLLLAKKSSMNEIRESRNENIAVTSCNKPLIPYEQILDGKSHLVFSNDVNFFGTICAAIDAATSSIRVYASHQISDAINQHLTDARDRGVDLLIIKDKSALQILDLRTIQRLFTRYVSISGKMHIKAILIDDSVYLIGSANLFERSLFRDLELLLIGSNPSLRKAIDKVLTEVDALSKPLNSRGTILIGFSSINRRARQVLKKVRDLYISM